jgi:hypothetical protein
MLTLKDARVCTMDRNASRTLNLRFGTINQWKAAGVNFIKNCVSLDEAGFNSYQIRRRDV